MTQKPPAYQWYPKDILASVRVAEMPADVECWYRRALDFCWVNGSLPADPQRCAAIIGKGCTVKGAEWVLKMFVFSRKDSTQKIHDRQEIERKKQAENRRKNSKAGKISAEKRRKDKELQQQKTVNERSTNVVTDVPTEGATKSNLSSSSSSSSPEDKKETRIGAAPFRGWDWPVKELVDAFPDYLSDRLTTSMAACIENDVIPGDEEAWSATIQHYKQNFNPSLNRYLPDKVANVLSVFKAKKAELMKNGSNKHTSKSNIGALKQSADYFDRKYGNAT